MATDTLTGNDTLTLYDRVFTDLADGDVSTFTFPNELFAMSTGKNGNTIYTKNETGNNSDLVLRLIMNSSDDQFLQEKLAAAESDFVAQELATGEFVKRVGDGEGAVSRNVYTVRGGIFTNKVDVKDNVAGDTEQAVSVYRMRFSRATRSVQ
jgi:hypothetical protein